MNINEIKTWLSLQGRGCSKSGLRLFYTLEVLKSEAKTKNEKDHYEELQRQWSEFCNGLALGYWK